MTDTQRRDAASTPAARSPAVSLGWRVLASPPMMIPITFACREMIARLERRHGPPACRSRHEIVRLWRIERFADVARGHGDWRLADGTVLHDTDAVLEFHIASDRLLAALRTGERSKDIILREFASLVPALEGRHETALIGSTILARQVERYGATTRPVPGGWHTRFDHFYRKLILLAFHPAGLVRVLSQDQPLVEAAISRADFCGRFRSGDHPPEGPRA